MASGETLGIIAGTGFEALFNLESHARALNSAGRFDYFRSNLAGLDLIVVPRHGLDHSIGPHRIPSKAHLIGLMQFGVEKVIAMSAVGSADERYSVGEIVIPDQYIDLTKSRDYTFYNDYAVHTDMSEPFCPHLRHALAQGMADTTSPVVHSGGVYACTEGPRYETPAEVEMIRRLGGHLVGMSAGPEIALARELGLCYALLTVISNLAAGYQDRVDSREILEVVWSNNQKMLSYLMIALRAAAVAERAAPCTDNDLESERLRRRLLGVKSRENSG